MSIIEEIHEVTDVHTNRHFVYTDGGHGDGYADYRALGKEEHHPLLRRVSVQILQDIIEHEKLDTCRPITLVGPETLGALMIKQVFFASTCGLPLQIHTRVFKKGTGKKEFVWEAPAHNVVNKDAQVVWMDDLLNAGSTFTHTNKLIEELGAQVRAIGVIGDRSGAHPHELGVPYIGALERFYLNRYDASDCPLCKKQLSIVRKPGHGHEYEKANPQYVGGYVDI